MTHWYRVTEPEDCMSPQCPCRLLFSAALCFLTLQSLSCPFVTISRKGSCCCCIALLFCRQRRQEAGRTTQHQQTAGWSRVRAAERKNRIQSSGKPALKDYRKVPKCHFWGLIWFELNHQESTAKYRWFMLWFPFIAANWTAANLIYFSKLLWTSTGFLSN